METFKKYTLSILVRFGSPIIGLFVYAYGGGGFNSVVVTVVLVIFGNSLIESKYGKLDD